MSIIRAEATAVTPLVEFDSQKGSFSMIGECYPENPLPFFNPILQTLRQYFQTQLPKIFSAKLQMQYVNSASTKGIRSLFALFNEAAEQGAQVVVHWVHDPEDDAMEELGDDLVEDFHALTLERQPIHG